MSYDEYWNGEAFLCGAYREAFRIKERHNNMMMHRQGRYVYDAILCCTPVLHAFAGKEAKPIDYPRYPYPMSKEEAQEQEKQREIEEYNKIKQRLKDAAERAELKKLIKNQGEVNAK